MKSFKVHHIVTSQEKKKIRKDTILHRAAVDLQATQPHLHNQRVKHLTM